MRCLKLQTYSAFSLISFFMPPSIYYFIFTLSFRFAYMLWIMSQELLFDICTLIAEIFRIYLHHLLSNILCSKNWMSRIRFTVQSFSFDLRTFQNGLRNEIVLRDTAVEQFQEIHFVFSYCTQRNVLEHERLYLYNFSFKYIRIKN